MDLAKKLNLGNCCKLFLSRNICALISHVWYLPFNQVWNALLLFSRDQASRTNRCHFDFSWQNKRNFAQILTKMLEKWTWNQLIAFYRFTNIFFGIQCRVLTNFAKCAENCRKCRNCATYQIPGYWIILCITNCLMNLFAKI